MTVLLIAYHFPPDAAIGGARPFRFARYLRRLGHRCVVITAAPPTGEDVIHVVDPLRDAPRKGIPFQVERICWKFFVRGDVRLAWSDAAFRAGRKFLDTNRGESVTLLSTAPPIGTHLAAWRLARYSGCRWVADFRDPLHLPGAESATIPAVAPALERLVVQAADLVIANTDAMGAMWERTYPEQQKKLRVLWNGYDPEDQIPQLPVPVRDCRLLSHVGELYGGRDIRPVLLAAGQLVESGAVAPGTLKIRQIGPADATELPPQAFTDQAVAAGWFELRPPVKPAEARKLAMESDGLLLLQPQSAVQVPGKLFEYLRMGRPIFAYVVRDSPVMRILQNAGVPFEAVFPGDGPEVIAVALQRFLSKLQRGPVPPSAWFEENFEASRQALTLSSLLEPGIAL